MRTILLPILLLGAVATVACSGDGPPSAAGDAQDVEPVSDSPDLADRQTSPPGDSQRDHAGQVEIEAAETASSQQEDSPTRANMIIRLTAELRVYPWTGEDWRPIQTFGPRTLLLVDGWTLAADGEIWLHLDLNGNLEGWARLEASPLSMDEAHSLPRLPEPEFPTAQLAGAVGELLTVSLLGMSADTARIAVRVGADDLVLWVDRWELERDGRLEGLRVYTGSTAGHWQLWRADEGERLEVELPSWSSEFVAWPNGPGVNWGLRAGKYPLLGRSLDGQWLAVRVDALEPPVIWVRSERLDESIDLNSLPVFLSAGLELVTLDEDGRSVSSTFAPEPMSYREWRDERELLLHERDGGSWLWDPETAALRQISDLRLSNISPDGRFAVANHHGDQSAEPDWHDPLDVALVSLQDGSAVTFPGVHKRWGTHHPGFQQFWSADSRWLLSTIHRWPEEPGRTRHFALSVDGVLVEIVPPEGEWIVDWLALRELEQAGREVVHLDAAGVQIARPWSDDLLEYGPVEPLEQALPALPEGWSRQWTREGLQAWSPDGRWLIATRLRWTEPIDEQGLAALPADGQRWGIREIGIFDREGRLVQIFRGYGLDCGTRRSVASWSPDGGRILFESRWVSCA